MLLTQAGSGVKRSSASGCRTGGPVPLNTVYSTADEQESTSFRPEGMNKHVKTEKFKLESLELVKTMLKSNDYLMKLDLKDAYYSVPIAEEHRKYLRFQFRGVTYEYQCLPLRLSSAPQAFTKLVKPVIAILRIPGI